MFGTWVSLDLAEDIERAFCDCQQKSAEIPVTYNGMTGMVYLDFQVPCIDGNILLEDSNIYQRTEARRISTASYAETGSAADTFVTQWCWYFKNDYGQWQRFEPETMQYTLETKYLAGQKEYRFTRENYRFKYVIDLVAMQQLNMDTNKSRDMIRRPLFVMGRNVVLGKTLPPVVTFPPIEVPLPEGWVPWDHTNDFELVKLSTDSLAYRETASKFFTTLSKDTIEVECIYRVQSHSQWDAFRRKEREMTATLERTRPGEVLAKLELFHGTDSLDSVRGICTHNFEYRVSGKNATRYGDGAYFARDASYSQNYTKPPNRFIFLANVLVGQFAKGESSYRRPPALPGSKLGLYDSCVDRLNDPTVYILFDKSQHYPAYLIQYKELPRVTADDTIYPRAQRASYTTGTSGGIRAFYGASQTYPAHTPSTSSAYPSTARTTYPSTPTTTYPAHTSNPSTTSPTTRSPVKPAKEEKSCTIQ